MADEVKVSVVMLTYQHAPYVSRAIDSVLEQTTAFPYELIIGDDASRDGTQEIVCAYRDRHPDRIRLILHDRNQGIEKNLQAILSRCRGELLAILEGDDFWTHPGKLRNQVLVFDASPDVALCGHRSVTVRDGEVVEGSEWPRHSRARMSVADAFSGTLFHTCTMMFRGKAVAALPPAIWSIFPLDRALQISLSQGGEVAFLAEVMAAYRIHSGGVWSGLSKAEKHETNLEFFRRILPLTSPRYRRLARQEVYRRWRALVLEDLREGRSSTALRRYWRLLCSPALWIRDPLPLFRPGLLARLLRVEPHLRALTRNRRAPGR